MFKKTICLLGILVAGFSLPSIADNSSAWIGTQFKSSQCTKIVKGTFQVKRKLCKITYDIVEDGDNYLVKGQLLFNDNFVAKNVSHVELEILMIDENFVCTKQLDQKVVAPNRMVQFSFVAAKLPSQRYVRTYYVIYYQQGTS